MHINLSPSHSTRLFPWLLILSSTLTSTIPTTARRPDESCVETCISNNPTQSWCTGHETGRASEECVCRRLDGIAMIECIQSCSPEDQWDFAGGLSTACRERVFPNATSSSIPTSGVEEGDEGVSSTVEVEADGVGTLRVPGVGVGVGVLWGVMALIL
ncbi:hypothetical protein BJX99DRAFT_263523 [Aspergillus californicus]